MSEREDRRYSGKAKHSGAQIFALALAILFLVQAACGVYLIYQGVIDWAVVEQRPLSEVTPIGTNFDISLGTFALTGIVPGILSALLYARITKARVRINGICAALMWLGFLAFGAVTGVFQGGVHLGYLILAIAPVLYTVCVVACAKSMKSNVG